MAEARRRASPVARAASGALDYLLKRSPIRALRRQTAAQREDRRVARLSEEFFRRVRDDGEFHRALIG
jgi:hypothetical protein